MSRESKQKFVRTRGRKPLENLASALPDLFASTAFTAAMAAADTARRPSLLLSANNGVDCELENLVDTAHFLAAAFDIFGTHALCDSLSLLRCNGGESLGFKKVDAGTFISEVGLETNEDERGGWAEMEDFGIPL